MFVAEVLPCLATACCVEDNVVGVVAHGGWVLSVAAVHRMEQQHAGTGSRSSLLWLRDGCMARHGEMCSALSYLMEGVLHICIIAICATSIWWRENCRQ
jgi:hypothetical protein